MTAKWFVIDKLKNSYGTTTSTTYLCLNCKYESKSFMGIQSHIRKHKRMIERFNNSKDLQEQKTLDIVGVH